MKKLMIAAAAAAMIGGANAVCVVDADNCGVCKGAGANVWDVKFTAKTTVLKSKAGNVCTGGGMTYRKQGTAKITGWIWNADNCLGLCDLDFGFTATGLTPGMALSWNKKAGFVVTPSIFAAQIDTKGSKLESWGALTDDAAVDIKFAGFGSYDTKKNYIKSLSGSFAGTLGNELIGAACGPLAGGVMTYDCAVYTYDDTTPTAAYGSWSIKYNKSASKKLAKEAAGFGIVAKEQEEYDPDAEFEFEADEEQLAAAAASILKFSKYGIDPENDVMQVEILVEDFAEIGE